MDVSSPISSVIPGVPGVVLQILARTELPLTGNGIADLADGVVSRAGVTKALSALVAHGLVECRPAGRANLYTLNRQHVAADAIVALSSLRQAMIDRLTALVGNMLITPVGVYLFGSAARGDGTAESDVDVLVVRPGRVDENVWTSQMMELARSVRAWTGNACEILEFTKSDLEALVRKKDRLVTSLRNDVVVISGPKLRSLAHI